MYYKLLKLIYLIIKYRLFFLIGFIPFLGWFKIFYNPNSIKQGKRLVKFIESLGPCFIKLGQLLSVRSDLIGEVYAKELSGLQEDVTSTKFSKIKKIIEKNFNSDIKIEHTNLVATGSVAEVYKLTIADIQSEVAVKILKPNIHKQFASDIRFLNKIFKIAQNNFKDAARLKLVKLIALLEKITAFELDLRFEAAAAEEMRDNFKDNDMLYIPKIYWDYSGKEILITEWINGVKVNNLEAIKSNQFDTQQIIYNLYLLFFTQVIKFGFFHGDMHPGNIIIMPNSQIAMVDFGIMGRLNNSVKNSVYEVWKAFLNQDYEAASKVHFSAGWVDAKYSQADFSLAVRAMIDPLFYKTKKNPFFISSLMEQLFEITKIFGMEIQNDLLLLQKNMFLLEGITQKLDNRINAWELAKNIINEQEFDLSLIDKAKHIYDETNNYIKQVVNFLEDNLTVKSNINNKSINLDRVGYNKFNYVIIIIMSVIILCLIWEI
ncbi:ABC1 kinase family protein [Rickettsiales bacterium LUAb2]